MFFTSPVSGFNIVTVRPCDTWDSLLVKLSKAPEMG